MRLRSVVFDVLLAAVVLALVEAETFTGALSTHRQGPHWAQAIGYGIPAALLSIRRLFPLACLLLGGAALAVEFALAGSPEGFGVMILPLITAYTVADREDRGRALWGLVAVLAVGVLWMAFDPLTRTWTLRLQGSLWLSPWVIAWLLGAYRRTRRLYVEGLLRERDERARAAVAEERSRIARELHDVVGHSLSVMTVQASAVRRLMRPDQLRERAALETVEATGRDALAEMRRMVGVLRAGQHGPELAPQPTLAELDQLVAKVRDVGLDVVVDCDLAAPLPPGLDLTAYRLVQEGLTNALRHAAASCAWVCVTYSGEGLQVSVRDNGKGGAASPGNGLRGMRERVALYGGSMTAAAAEGGGFELQATLPLAAGAL